MRALFITILLSLNLTNLAYSESICLHESDRMILQLESHGNTYTLRTNNQISEIYLTGAKTIESTSDEFAKYYSILALSEEATSWVAGFSVMSFSTPQGLSIEFLTVLDHKDPHHPFMTDGQNYFRCSKPLAP